MIDILFTCLLGIMIIAFLAIMMMAEQSKTGDIPAHAEFMITLEWDPNSSNDIDLWLKLPNGQKIFFRNKSQSGVFLDRDDLGTKNDGFYMENGDFKVININREVITIRGIFPGTYTVNVHAFSLGFKDAAKTEKVKVTLTKINPFAIGAMKELVLDQIGQELTAFSFTVNDKGWIEDVNSYFVPYVYDSK